MILLFALLACPSPAAPPTPPAPPPASPAADSACVKTCMDGRMMQAVSIDKIRSDCQVDCGEAPKPPF